MTALFAGLCDDAAIFPPGLAPLPAAVAAHDAAAGEWYAALVGPLVVSAAAAAELGPLVAARSTPLAVSVTFPAGPGPLAGTLAALAALPVTVEAVEVAVPPGTDASVFLAELAAGLCDATCDVYVEIPRDERGRVLLAALPAGYRAKFRTGGVRADLYPDEAELAASIGAALAAGVPFKATAGLHHALRNTDPETGFEQHGFLNLLLATDALARGGDDAAAAALLAERDGPAVARLVAALDPAVRERFVSFGTCSIADPVTELTGLGLLTAPDTLQGAPR